MGGAGCLSTGLHREGVEAKRIKGTNCPSGFPFREKCWRGPGSSLGRLCKVLECRGIRAPGERRPPPSARAGNSAQRQVTHIFAGCPPSYRNSQRPLVKGKAERPRMNPAPPSPPATNRLGGWGDRARPRQLHPGCYLLGMERQGHGAQGRERRGRKPLRGNDGPRRLQRAGELGWLESCRHGLQRLLKPCSQNTWPSLSFPS